MSYILIIKINNLDNFNGYTIQDFNYYSIII